MLTVSDLSSNYGNIRAVKNVSLDVRKGQLVALLGANGSGKSTTMKTVAGWKQPVSGTVTFDGRDITGMATYKLARIGFCFVPERPDSVLQPLTVRDNLALAAFAKRDRLRELEDWVFTLFPRLADRRNQIAGSMSGGEQQMLALARGLMTDPRLMLIDSPAIGLAPSIVDTVYDAILGIRDRGVSMLVIEQNAAMALVVCDYVYILNRGRIAMQGESDQLRESSEVVDAYLG